MDFFQHQAYARKKTGVLVFYFGAAVALIVAALYLAVLLILSAQEEQLSSMDAGTLWQPQILVPVVVATVVVIGLGSLYKIAQLRGGGAVVAKMLGARPISPNTQDLDERVLLNVVEEMAIASGVSVPPVYVMDEERGINAFAAGFGAGDAVIAVTRGTLETLSRDELQGVVAHEFSHILNGDMRLNIRLIGVLHGILLIALAGYATLRTMRYARSSRDKKGGGLVVIVLLVGLACLVIGYVGVFFGRLIKSAVSRQREFLADASAVQFTRNPGGISGALKKIGGAAQGSRVRDGRAEEVSHMFFGNALRSGFLNLMSTHPPLADRIRRIEPRFDGKFAPVSRVQRSARDLLREDIAKVRGQPGAGRPRSETDGAQRVLAFQPAMAVASVGTLDSEHIDHAAGLIASIPESFREAVRDPLGAIATVHCLLLDTDPDMRRAQLRLLDEHADEGSRHEVGRLLPHVGSISAVARLPLAELALPALYQMTLEQYRSFRGTVEQLIAADEQENLFEQALQRLLVRRLAAHFEKPKVARTWTAATLSGLVPECSVLLSAFAREGQREEADAAAAFLRGAARLEPVGTELALLPKDQCRLERLKPTMRRLAASHPQVKKSVLEAAAACIETDGHVTVEEAELLRILAAALDCPMPPLLAGQVVSAEGVKTDAPQSRYG